MDRPNILEETDASLMHRLQQTMVAVALTVLLSACSSTPWYDNPPLTPIVVSPPEGTLVTPAKAETFVWLKTPQSESYDFHIFNAHTNAIDQYSMTGLKPEELCSDDTCSIQLQLSLPDSARHAWRVRASNIAGKSAWTRSLFTFSSTGEQ